MFAGCTCSFIFENDILGGTDTDCTNSVRLDHVTRREALPFGARPLRRDLGWLTDAGDWCATCAISRPASRSGTTASG